jgi:urate oxidase
LTGAANTVDFDTDTIKATLVRSSTYTPNQTTDDFYADVTTPVAASGALSMSVSGANVDCTDFSFTAVSAGAAIDTMVLWKDTGNTATSRVAAKYDISVTPNGADIEVVVNASGLFTL